jgi:hypothetical protein
VGSRANIAIVEDGTYSLYYCHWCAQTLPRDLFWGPEYALAFTRAQLFEGGGLPALRADEPCPAPPGTPVEKPEGWLDDVWSEGGAVIDLDRRVLLLYGGEDIEWDVPLRRLYLALLRQVWQSWEVRWALIGILELADYVGLPRHLVMTEPEEWDPPPIGRVDTKRVPTIASVVFEDGTLQLFPLFMQTYPYLYAGPQTVDILAQEQGFSSLPLGEWESWIPQGGFHIDVQRREIECWMARTGNADPEIQMAPRWPGWRFCWLGDDYEAHLERLGGRIRWPTRSTDELLDWLHGILMQEPRNPLPSFLKLTEKLAEKHGSVPMNPYALHYASVDMSRFRRQQILDRAFQAWRQAGQQP